MTSWVFNYTLVNRFLLKKKYRLFFLYTFYLLVISLDLEMVLVFVAFILIGYYDHDNMKTIIENFRLMPLLMYLIVLLNVFIHLVAQLMKSQHNQAGLKSRSVLLVRSDRMNRSLNLEGITYLESMADYVKIFVHSEVPVITREKISHMEARLPENFIRIHRSYVVNVNFLESYTKESVIVHGKELPISRTYKIEALQKILIHMEK